MIDYEGGDLTAVSCCLCQWSGRHTHSHSLCVQAVGGSLSGLAALISDENTLEVCYHK